MSFLAPLFLLGAAAIVLPVLFHFIRRTTRERTVFSSLMFLQASPPRVTRRSRLEHLLLLFLRCLVLCLLALGFARPFINKAMDGSPSDAVSKRVIFLVDTSASMRRAQLWEDARERVASVLSRLSPADQVSVLTFDRDLRPLVSFEQWNATPGNEKIALVKQRLNEVSPGWLSTHLGNALVSAAETLADPGNKHLAVRNEIVVISDLQEGSHLEQLQGYEWPKGVEVSVEPLNPKHLGNAGLQLVTDPDTLEVKSNAAARVRVSNAADSKREQFQVGWTASQGREFVGKPLDVYVPPGQSRIVQLEFKADRAQATGDAKLPTRNHPPIPQQIMLQGDEEDFDNSMFVVPPERAKLTVMYFGPEAEKDPQQPLYFLQRAFQDTRRQTVHVQAVPADDLPASLLRLASMFIVSEPLAASLADALREQALGGKTLLFMPKNQSLGATLSRVLGAGQVSIEEVRPQNYAMLAEIDFGHPLFSSFADPRFSDFTKIHFWQYRRIDIQGVSGLRVLARFDDGAPAILEASVGKGRVLVIASGWQPNDSQLALSTKFVPMLYSMLEESGGPISQPGAYHVGDTLPLAALGFDPKLSKLVAPDGSQIAIVPGGTNHLVATKPGIYRILSGEKGVSLAVNLDPSESRTGPLPLDELARLGAPLSRPRAPLARASETKARFQREELENRQKLWRWLVVTALGILLAETWLAGWTSRKLLLETKTAP